jgi:hypothetical protein
MIKWRKKIKAEGMEKLYGSNYQNGLNNSSTEEDGTEKTFSRLNSTRESNHEEHYCDWYTDI